MMEDSGEMSFLPEEKKLMDALFRATQHFVTQRKDELHDDSDFQALSAACTSFASEANWDNFHEVVREFRYVGDSSAAFDEFSTYFDAYDTWLNG